MTNMWMISSYTLEKEFHVLCELEFTEWLAVLVPIVFRLYVTVL